MTEKRHDVLCQCGWGKLGCLESELPEECPVCGYEWMTDDDGDGEPADIDCDSYWDDHDIYGGGAYCGDDY